MKRRAVRMTSVASDDIVQLLEYTIATAGLAAGQDLDARLDAALATLATVSQRGRIVPELQVRGIHTFRELIRPPYRIVCRVDSRDVWVLAVVDGRRDLASLLRERARR